VRDECSERLRGLLQRVARDGEELDGPDMARELMLLKHRIGYLVPALVAVKVRGPHWRRRPDERRGREALTLGAGRH
jgi:hypothetical protein